MAKQIRLLTPIYSYSADAFIAQLEEYKNEDIEVLINTDGGDITQGWTMAYMFNKHNGKKSIKVGGKAHSMGAYLLCYSEDVECLDMSKFVLHRAAYSAYFENDPTLMTDEVKASLKKDNDYLKAALVAKIDVEKFNKLKGVSVDDIFAMDKRINVELTAHEAKAIGLVAKIVKLTPEVKAQWDSYSTEAIFSQPEHRIAAEEKPKQETKTAIMTIEKLKAEHKEVYAEIIAAEQDRVNAWLVYNSLDPKAVAEGIKSGKNISQTAMAEFSMKALSAEGLKKLAAEATPAVATAEAPSTEKTAEQKEIEAFRVQVQAELKKANPTKQ